MTPDREFWSRQRVLLTGHTGFKGTWLTLWLEQLGATTIGLALDPITEPNLHGLTKPHNRLVSRIGDVRNLALVADVVAEARPTIAIHMAAKPLVRYSYREPVETIATNVMGTAHVLQALRSADELRAALVITTDKVYANADRGEDFGEDDRLGGDDPYSASKAAAEMVTACFAESFFGKGRAAVATARAGNVIGGGDWSEDRLIPDVWRSRISGMPLILRNPDATRPWQYVLDLLSGYLVYVERLVAAPDDLPRALNFGPDPGSALRVADVTDAVLEALGSGPGWELAQGAQPKEMQLLSLDASLARKTLGWRPRLSGREGISWTTEWYRAFDEGADPRALSLSQIARYEALG